MKIGLTRTTIDSDTVRFGQASFSPLPIVYYQDCLGSNRGSCALFCSDSRKEY